jgi:GAF domain-containing protein
MRRTVRPKARKAPSVRLSAAKFQEQLERLERERDNALQQHRATSEVLRVISNSPTNLQPVFNTIASIAPRLCCANHCLLYRFDGELLHLVAHHNVPSELLEMLQRLYPMRPSRMHAVGRAIMSAGLVEIEDTLSDPEYQRKVAVLGGWRSMIAVPMLRKAVPIGAIAIQRAEAGKFPEGQIALLKTFADQAVIAIENVRLFDEVQARTRELSESLEQQTATSEVLKVISSSPGELEPVFEAMLANATRICEATFGNLWLFEGNAAHAVAFHGMQRFVDYIRGDPVIDFGEHPTIPLARVFRTKQVIHIPDLWTDESYIGKDRAIVSLVETARARTVVGVPMLKDDELVGAIVIYRTEVRPFTDKQIELLTNFASQAVIAIENTRLLNELRESLQQQTATADVLKVISSSVSDLKPVFEIIGQSAERLCDAEISAIAMVDGDVIRLASINGVTKEGVEAVRNAFYPMRPDAETVTARTIRSGTVCHVADVLDDPLYTRKDAARAGGFRGSLGVPMIRDGQVVGAIFVARKQPGLFTDNQVQLLKTFADQAVIAIENARLFNETKEALEQQTATADVLKVISRSTFDLQTVLNTLAESAAQLCDAEFANIWRPSDGVYRLAASSRSKAYFENKKYLETVTIEPGRGTIVGRTLLDGKTVHVRDVQADPGHNMSVAINLLGGYRTVLGVPLQREGVPIGVIALTRSTVRPFTEKQIELVETFADQAVIAIENARLFDEVQKRTQDLTDSLQQQTATADVLKVISRSTFDLQTVLTALIESAARLCNADQGAIAREINGAFFRAATYGHSVEFSEYIRETPVQLDRSSVAGRALVEGRIVHIADVQADAEYTFSPGLNLGDFRTVIGVPMLREGTPTGVLALSRKEVLPFTDKQIELAMTFADQAAIAIENVRLFQSVEARTRELAASLEDLRATQDRLIQTQKLASLGQLTAGIAHEIKNPLNFVNNFSGISSELVTELQEALADVSVSEKRRSEITELMDTLRGNLDKIVQHGKRADAIVKNMLLHSREDSGEHRVVDINVLVEESLNLAYHGARAEKQGFNITMEQSLDPAAGQADVFPQDLTRVLLNLISNGFYAATKRSAEADGDGYEPTLSASTRSLGDRVEIRVRDNGTGIPPEVKEKMFNPFFTTKPAGEGTGLGLSICHDIIVKQHGGSIEVDTQPGEFTEIRVTLPRAAALLPERT